MNERLIKEDQLEYQEELRSHYKDMLSELSAVMNEQVRLTWGVTAVDTYKRSILFPSRVSFLAAEITVPLWTMFSLLLYNMLCLKVEMCGEIYLE